MFFDLICKKSTVNNYFFNFMLIRRTCVCLFSEKIRELMVSNFKNVVEEIETSIIKETLQKYVEIHNINEEFRSFLPETGKSRQDRVYRFLTFVLKNDEYVLELEKVFQQNNLENLLEENIEKEKEEKENEYAIPSNEGTTEHKCI